MRKIIFVSQPLPGNRLVHYATQLGFRVDKSPIELIAIQFGWLTGTSHDGLTRFKHFYESGRRREESAIYPGPASILYRGVDVGESLRELGPHVRQLTADLNLDELVGLLDNDMNRPIAVARLLPAVDDRRGVETLPQGCHDTVLFD